MSEKYKQYLPNQDTFDWNAFDERTSFLLGVVSEIYDEYEINDSDTSWSTEWEEISDVIITLFKEPNSENEKNLLKLFSVVENMLPYLPTPVRDELLSVLEDFFPTFVQSLN